MLLCRETHFLFFNFVKGDSGLNLLVQINSLSGEAHLKPVLVELCGALSLIKASTSSSAVAQGEVLLTGQESWKAA